GLILPVIFTVYVFIIKIGFIPASVNVIWHVYFVISFLYVLFVLKQLFGKSTAARLFALSMGIMTITAILQVFSNAGFLNNNFLNDHSILLASIVEMMVLACATFLNVWEERKRISRHVAQLE